MAIVRQVDADYEGDGIVAFIDSTPRYRDNRTGDGTYGEMVTGETYRVELHRKPLDASGRAFKFCRHEHRSIDAAVRCAKKLMRAERSLQRVDLPKARVQGFDRLFKKLGEVLR